MASACGRRSPWARAVVVLTLAATLTSAQNLIVNGDMDGVADVTTYNGVQPPGWTGVWGGTDIWDVTSTAASTVWQSSNNGGTFVHGVGVQTGTEWVEQVVSGLVVGGTYELNFEQSISDSGFGASDVAGFWRVTFGADTLDSAVMPMPAFGVAVPWQPQTLTFIAAANTQVLRFTARNVTPGTSPLWRAELGLDGVTLHQAGTAGAPGQWLYSVDDANVLRSIEVDNGCTVTTIGVTQDTPSGPVRRLRGLTFVSILDALLGMTREGELVRVDRFTGKTSVIMSLPFGNPATEFWSGLTFDGVETLYTANAFDGHELVAIKVPAFTSTLVGSTQTSGGQLRQILGLDFLAQTAPSLVPGPVHGVLYGSDRSTQSLVRIDTNTAVVTHLGANLGLAAPQAIAFHPFSGTLFCLDDQGTGGADLTTYDFTALMGNPHCALPFEIVEQTATPDFGWGGLAFTRPGPWSNQGCALAGVFGDPLLVGTGSMVPGSMNAVELSNAAPGANSLLFASLSSTPVPFVGGMLKPFPFTASLTITLPASGGFTLPFTVPPGWPSGTELWAQWAVQDVTAILGVSLSNAVVGVVP